MMTSASGDSVGQTGQTATDVECAFQTKDEPFASIENDDDGGCFDDKGKQEEKNERKPKTLKDHSRREYIFVIVTGLSLAFSAGYTNGVCLSGFIHSDTSREVQQSVAGVTGLYTASAIFLGEKDLDQMAFMLGTMFCVMAGACISSLLNPWPVAFEVGPKYGPTFLLGGIFMTFGAVAALHNSAREFYFTAIANGIQNGISSMYSANLIRTTHLTGTTTDIGLFIGMALRGNRTNNWKLYILVGLAAFWTGSLVGFFASRAKRQYSLIFNACFFFAIGLSVVVFFVRVHKITFCQALFGVGKLGAMYEHIGLEESGVGERMSEEELIDLYDEIDLRKSGHVDQDMLLELLASKDVHIKRTRKSLVGTAAAAIMQHEDDGDWTLSKEDWARLVRQHSEQDSILRTRNDALAARSTSTRYTVPPSSGPAAIRQMSIAQIRQSKDIRASVRFS